MLQLNIISNELKKDLVLKQIYKNIKKLLILVAISITIYAGFYLISKYILQKHFEHTMNQTTLITKNIKNYSLQVNEINSQVNSIISIQQSFAPQTELIKRLSDNISPDITLYQLKIDNANKLITLNGKAKTRESLLDLKNYFEDSGNFGDVYFPIKNLLEKTNINFELSAKIKNYEFE